MDEYICLYHGTKFKYTAKEILRSGFKRGCFFAKDMGDAIEFGGKYVFMVVFNKADLPDNWQVVCMNKIAPKRIMDLTLYESTNIFKNEKLRSKIFSNALEHITKSDYTFTEIKGVKI
jgi:hypothetical protein